MSINPDQDRTVPADAAAPQGGPGNTGPSAAQPAADPDVGTLLQKAEAEAADFKDAWLRAKAETENVRKQAQGDISKAHRYAIERFAQELLDVKDALESSLAAGNAAPETLKAGVELTLKNLNAAFDKAQIAEINPIGQKYDPHRHQAIAAVASDQPANTVLQVFQKGYLLNDRILRPALVAVAKGAEAADGQAPQQAGPEQC
jgi:molecular chaperone GrpE